MSPGYFFWRVTLGNLESRTFRFKDAGGPLDLTLATIRIAITLESGVAVTYASDTHPSLVTIPAQEGEARGAVLVELPSSVTAQLPPDEARPLSITLLHPLWGERDWIRGEIVAERGGTAP